MKAGDSADDLADESLEQVVHVDGEGDPLRAAVPIDHRLLLQDQPREHRGSPPVLVEPVEAGRGAIGVDGDVGDVAERGEVMSEAKRQARVQARQAPDAADRGLERPVEFGVVEKLDEATCEWIRPPRGLAKLSDHVRAAAQSRQQLLALLVAAKDAEAKCCRDLGLEEPRDRLEEVRLHRVGEPLGPPLGQTVSISEEEEDIAHRREPGADDDPEAGKHGRADEAARSQLIARGLDLDGGGQPAVPDRRSLLGGQRKGVRRGPVLLEYDVCERISCRCRHP